MLVTTRSIILFLCCCISLTAAQRLIIKYDPAHTSASVLSAAAAKASSDGPLVPVAAIPGLLVLKGPLRHASLTPKQLSALDDLAAKAKRWQGVLAAEPDAVRIMHRPLADKAATAPSQKTPNPLVVCPRQDRVVGSGLLPEVEPYGFRMVQANSPKLPNTTVGAGVLICIIDSGMDARHPDLVGNVRDGCKYEDLFANAGCPYEWDGDLVGHGTVRSCVWL
jgi:subtilisin family serine protease